eukprot:6178627-Pleurochrysis_carterae.AAC.5
MHRIDFESAMICPISKDQCVLYWLLQVAKLAHPVNILCRASTRPRVRVPLLRRWKASTKQHLAHRLLTQLTRYRPRETERLRQGGRRASSPGAYPNLDREGCLGYA